MWHPKTLKEEPLDFKRYEVLSRIASKAAAAPAP
jgi:hypothetical protein